MKLVFISNYFNHHQRFLSDELYRVTGGSYLFIETEEMEEERKNMGWGNKDYPSYVCTYENYKNNFGNIKKIIDEAEATIFGSAPMIIKDRLDNKKISFRYNERLYKKGIPSIFRRMYQSYLMRKRYLVHKEEYLLCNSAYAYSDFRKLHVFKNKGYKWGYFTEVKEYDIEKLIENKENNKKLLILWAGRLIDLKHPDDVLELAKRLVKDNYDFKVRIIGDGSNKIKLEKIISDYKLEKYVDLVGMKKPEEVRKEMESANIYLFTSDFNEGWGAVLNESMNSGCAVVASHAIGSVPFLIKNNENGLIYENGNIDSLYRKVKFLLDSKTLRTRLGKKAYSTIYNVWNPKVAAERYVEFIKEIKENGECNLYTEGPYSKAELLDNGWYKDE